MVNLCPNPKNDDNMPLEEELNRSLNQAVCIVQFKNKMPSVLADKEEEAKEYSYLYGLMPLMPPMPCAYFESNFDARKNALCRWEIPQ